MRVLVVDEEVPYPPNSGKRIRSFNLVRHLASRHEIVWLSRQLEGVGSEVTQFESFGPKCVVVDDPVRRKSGPAFFASLFLNLIDPNPYVVSSHRSRKLERVLGEALARQPFDVLHCEWTPYAANLLRFLPRPSVAMAHNVESVVWRRNYNIERNPLKRAYIRLQWKKMEAFERAVLCRFSRIVAVSETDRGIISNWVPHQRIGVVANGVDVGHFRRGDALEVPDSFVFTGSLDWRPNVDAVCFFLDEVWPNLKRLRPGAQFWAVGRNPLEIVKERVAGLDSVKLYASVPDVRPFLDRAAVCVVPLRSGSGSRLKILEALAMEKAVVSTTVGAEGLEVVNGRHLILADGARELAESLAYASGNEQFRRELGRNGRELVEKDYRWEALASRLETVWTEAASCRTFQAESCR